MTTALERLAAKKFAEYTRMPTFNGYHQEQAAEAYAELQELYKKIKRAKNGYDEHGGSCDENGEPDYAVGPGW